MGRSTEVRAARVRSRGGRRYARRKWRGRILAFSVQSTVSMLRHRSQPRTSRRGTSFPCCSYYRIRPMSPMSNCLLALSAARLYHCSAMYTEVHTPSYIAPSHGFVLCQIPGHNPGAACFPCPPIHAAYPHGPL